LLIKSNADLREELGIVTGARDAFPRIETAIKGAGSVSVGLRKWNGLLALVDQDGTPHLVVSPSCPQIADFCKKWKGWKDDPLKNVGDAGRYILNRMVGKVEAVSGTQHY
jgi:hypothetical protein